MNDTDTARLSALAAAGLFAESRIARGAGGRETSDLLMGQITDLLSGTVSGDAAQIPPDDVALERLKAVNGIGDALAQKALDALKGK